MGNRWSRYDNRLVAIAVLAVAFLVLGTIGVPLTTDEAFTWRVIEYPWSEMVGRVAEDGHAPLHFIALKGYSVVAGRSLTSLRLFSLLCYSMGIAAHYAAMRLALPVLGDALGGKFANDKTELILLMAILAFNPLQVFVAANARMYSLGMLFVSLSSCAYFKALATNGRNATWLWVVWGILTGAGMLTHHFVGFMAAGQILASLWLISLKKGPARRKFQQLAAPFLGCLSAFVVYSPWLSVIRDQFAEVGRQFWIGPLTFNGAAGLFSSWLTGTPAQDWSTSLVFLTSLVAIWCLAVGLWYRPVECVPFASHALVPWILCLAISLASGRPLLQDRYLVFGQASAFTAICLGWGTQKSVPWRVATGCLLVGSHIVGSVSAFARSPVKTDTFAQCVETVLAHDDGNTSKTIFVRWPADVNRTRYFLDQAKRNDFQVRLLASPFRVGHVGHIAALEPQEIYWSPFQDLPELTRGAWVIFDEPANSALGSLGAVDILAEYEIPKTNSTGGKAILVRKSHESVVPIP